MGTIPLSWNDALFSSVKTSNAVTLNNGGTLSNTSITDSGNIASVVGNGSFTLDTVRINSQEGVRIGGSGNIRSFQRGVSGGARRCGPRRVGVSFL